MKSHQGMTLLGVTLIFIACTLLYPSCNEPTLVGSEILPPEDAVNVSFTDTLSIQTTTVLGDTQRVYSPTSSQQLTTYLVGRLNDPYFGNSFSAAYAQLRLLTTSPKFENSTLDSVVLSLVYNNQGHYGKVNEPQTLKIYRVTELMSSSQTYYSNQTFSKGALLGQKTFMPNVVDSVTILNPEGDTVFERQVAPQVRIPLSSAFGNLLLNSSDQMTTNDEFVDFMNGIYIEPGRDNEAIFRYNLTSSKVSLYYSQTDSLFDANDNFEKLDTTPKVYDLVINGFSTKLVNLEHDRNAIGQVRTPAPIKKYLNNTSDSLIFVQSMEGTYAKINFPYAADLNNIIVNRAELIVTIANTEEASTFPFPDQLIAVEKVNDSYVLIEDVVKSFDVAGSFELFGGGRKTELINGEQFIQYKMNITGHFQEVVEGIVPPSIYITTFPQAQVAERVILGGGNHSKYPVKLKLTYTRID